MLSEIILAVVVLALLAERVWERVWAETPPAVEIQPAPLAMAGAVEAPPVEYVPRRPIPPEAEWDGYEGQAGIS